jgi:hypothetical protein
MKGDIARTVHALRCVSFTINGRAIGNEIATLDVVWQAGDPLELRDAVASEWSLHHLQRVTSNVVRERRHKEKFRSRYVGGITLLGYGEPHYRPRSLFGGRRHLSIDGNVDTASIRSRLRLLLIARLRSTRGHRFHFISFACPRLTQDNEIRQDWSSKLLEFV